MQDDRIEWCDIYKGLLMLFVVIGHSTGLFNRYIYQFHMAAFFMISGYTSRIDRKSLFYFLIDKFYKIMVPFFFLGMSGDAVFYILKLLNVLGKVSTTTYPVSFQQAILELFKNLTIYCDWLGALWFLPVLFGATILAKIIYFLARGNNKWMLLISVLVFYFSEKNVITENTIVILAGLAQFYFIIGMLLRKVMGDYEKSKKAIKRTALLSFLVCLLWYICSNSFIEIVVDWPSRNFNGTIHDILLPIFGITATYMISLLFNNFKSPNKLFSYIGKNTMGIMSFHFIGFKVAYALLILLNCMETDDFRNLVPTVEVGNQYWIFIVVISLAVSLLIWRELNKIKILAWIFGRSKVVVGRYGKRIESAIVFLSDRFKQKYARIDKIYVNILTFFVILCYVVIGVQGIIQIKDSTAAFHITFPDTNPNVNFKDGWLLQGEGENYRWVEKESTFSVFLTNQSEFHLDGYVPDNVTGMSKAAIYINDYLIMEKELGCNEGFTYDVLIGEYMKKYAENEIKIVFDGVREPKETDEDQRIFSALISAIEIQ